MIKNVEDIHAVALETVIAEHVKLDKRGTQLIGCCPFHSEKTPSFHVSPSKGIYKCFGCGEGGNSPVTFLMSLKGMTYPEALEEVARLGRIKVDYEPGSRDGMLQRSVEERDRTKQLRTALEALLPGMQAPEWVLPDDLVDCEGKLYTGHTIRTWGIGYAPADGNYMIQQARTLGIERELTELNVLKSLDGGGLRSTFRDRLLFPIRDERGGVVALAGRKPVTDTDKKNPKYINSAESLLYNKSKVLYGLHENKAAIHKAGKVYLVEGYSDVITMWVHGFPAVASCGTALTQEQCKLLKRYADVAVILRDGDEAGLKAATRDVELLTAAGISAKVCLMPDGHDPHSFLDQHTARGLEALESETAEDAVVWRIMREWDDKDTFKKETAYNIAGQLLSLVESDTLRDQYVRELTAKNRMGAVKTILTDAVKRERDKRLDKANKRNLNHEQERDIIEFGIYRQNNCYFASSSPESGGVQISNFVVKPILLVIGSQQSERVVEIVNEYGKSFTIVMPSENFTGLTEFKKGTESKGNFRFWGKPEQFERIKAMIYKECRDTFPIRTMGWHSKGFYAWGNGISVNGKFLRADEYGVVAFDTEKYWLPAFSNIGNGLHGDDEDEQFELEKKFRLYDHPDAPDVRTWLQMTIEVHGMNGAAGAIFYIASLYRDIIFGKLSFFPHLNLFGPPGAGKSFMARSLVAMWGREIDMDPFNLLSGTPVAFKRKLAQVANGGIWFDEYSNGVDIRRIEALKGAYDGAGHEKGVADGGTSRTKTTKVKSALIISGQQQPTQDVALFKRVVSLNFNSRNNSLAKQQAARRLKEIEKTGVLTQITQYLLSFREQVTERFSELFDESNAFLTNRLIDEGTMLETRIVQNHIVLIAIATCMVEAGVEFPFKLTELIDFLYENMKVQSEAIYNEDELSVWWKIIAFLYESKQISHYHDFVIEPKLSESFNVEGAADRNASSTRRFDNEKTLLYIRFSKTHPLYQERHQRQRNKPGLDLGALQYYLRQSPGYMGYKRAKKFGNNTYGCYVFDTSELPIEIPVSTGGEEQPAF